MSFLDLKITELRKVADSFGVDVTDAKTKQEIAAILEEEGISYQMYDKFTGAEKQEIEVPEIEKKKREKIMKTTDAVLVKMERGNFSYQALGHTFTQEHPFVAMSESDAQKIFDTQSGFRLATPREAQEYYS
jgi:UDP-N-acetyl-D-mannosaminuronate dehydrogenase